MSVSECATHCADQANAASLVHLGCKDAASDAGHGRADERDSASEVRTERSDC